MNICKNAAVSQIPGGVPDKADLALIAALAKGDVEQEDVYAFEIMLCDSEVDRDFERFDHDALVALSELFVGKPGIFDHNWSAHEQVARIYKTEVRHIPGVMNSDGEPYEGLFARAYMLRGEENDALIRSIEAGIHREVSVSCAVGARICSVCGEPYDSCIHRKGGEYEGKLCHVVLTEPSDAYEWSFVAVPAQRAAGVVKKYGGERMDIRKFLESSGDKELLCQLDELEKQAQLGSSYLQSLRAEVVRLGGLSDCGIASQTLKSMVDKLDESELLGMKKAYGEKIKGMYPTSAQLTGKTAAGSSAENSEYRV